MRTSACMTASMYVCSVLKRIGPSGDQVEAKHGPTAIIEPRPGVIIVVAIQFESGSPRSHAFTLDIKGDGNSIRNCVLFDHTATDKLCSGHMGTGIWGHMGA